MNKLQDFRQKNTKKPRPIEEYSLHSLIFKRLKHKRKKVQPPYFHRTDTITQQEQEYPVAVQLAQNVPTILLKTTKFFHKLVLFFERRVKKGSDENLETRHIQQSQLNSQIGQRFQSENDNKKQKKSKKKSRFLPFFKNFFSKL